MYSTSRAICKGLLVQAAWRSHDLAIDPRPAPNARLTARRPRPAFVHFAERRPPVRTAGLPMLHPTHLRRTSVFCSPWSLAALLHQCRTNGMPHDAPKPVLQSVRAKAQAGGQCVPGSDFSRPRTAVNSRTLAAHSPSLASSSPSPTPSNAPDASCPPREAGHHSRRSDHVEELLGKKLKRMSDRLKDSIGKSGCRNLATRRSGYQVKLEECLRKVC